MKKIFTLLILLTAFNSFGQIIAQWNFDADVNTATTETNVTASPANFGSAVTNTGYFNSSSVANGRAYSAENWPTGSVVDLNSYIEVTITPAAGRTLTLSSFTFLERRSGTGITSIVVRSSRDGFVADLFSATVPDNTNYRTQTVDLSSANFQGIDFAFTLRIYGFNAEAATGAWRFDNLTINGNTPLPVTLISFKASTLGQETILDWNTTDAVNFSHFSVERGNDARSFESIGRVDALKATSAEETTYRFTDDSPRFGLNYYRLKQIDIDGSHEYSKIVSVNMTESSPVVVYPNPVASILRLKNTEKDDVRFYRLYDAMGKIVREIDTTSSQISVDNLPTGVYNLQLVDSRQTIINRKFIKQ